MVEQGTENPRVGSSILSLGTRESKGLQRKLQAFFRYRLLPDARLRAAARGRFHRAGLPALPPSFPAFSFVLSLSRFAGLSPALPVASRCPYGPSSVRAAPRSSTPRAAYPDNHALLPCAVAACPLSRPSRKEKSGKETSAPSRSLWQVFGAWPGSQPGVRQGTCLPRQRPARSLLPASGAADRVRHWGRRPHAGAFLRPGCGRPAAAARRPLTLPPRSGGAHRP